MAKTIPNSESFTADRILAPSACQTMAEVRAGVDATDQQLLSLLEQRFGYMRAAARIKQRRGAVRDEARKAEVIANAEALAAEAGLPAAEIARLWDDLVEASIAYELGEWDKLRAAPNSASASDPAAGDSDQQG